MLRRAYQSGVSIQQLAVIHNKSEETIRNQLKRMNLLPDYTAVERYGVSSYYDENDVPDESDFSYPPDIPYEDDPFYGYPVSNEDDE